MRLFNKISKSGVCLDKKIEHFILLELCRCYKLVNKPIYGDIYLQYYETVLKVDVSEYNDGIVRFIVTAMTNKAESGEIGRLLISKSDYESEMKYLVENSYRGG